MWTLNYRPPLLSSQFLPALKWLLKSSLTVFILSYMYIYTELYVYLYWVICIFILSYMYIYTELYVYLYWVLCIFILSYMYIYTELYVFLYWVICIFIPSYMYIYTEWRSHSVQLIVYSNTVMCWPSELLLFTFTLCTVHILYVLLCTFTSWCVDFLCCWFLLSLCFCRLLY